MKHQLLSMTFAAASMAVCAMSAGAQSITEFPPLLKPQQEQANAKAQHRAPLNQWAKKGVKAFGYTNIDMMRYRSFCWWYESQTMLDKLNKIFTDEEEQRSRDLWMLNAGAYNPEDGCYYAYKVEYYTIGITYAHSWIKADPMTGEWDVVAELPYDCHFGTPLYDIAYCTYDDTMYGLVQNVDNAERALSRLGVVNMDDSSVSELIDLDEYYFCMAFDYDGTLWAIRWDYNDQGILTGTRLDKFNQDFKVVDSKPIKVDGKEFKSYFQHGLAFDYTNGNLLWTATNSDGNQYVVSIDPETGTTHNYGMTGYNEVLLGLYVPYTTADHRSAPAIVSDLNFTIDAEGQNNVTISWTNPSLTWNRKDLTNLKEVAIYRDSHKDGDTPIVKLDATGKEGQAMQYEDKGATQGVHTYYVMGVNEFGEGVEASIEAYVGRDKPGMVNDLTVATDDNNRSVVITWTAPTIGDSEGWFDKTITYDIVRNPGNKTLATGVTQCTYKDANIEEAQYYTYTVTPVTSDGNGTPRTTDGIIAGASLKVPFLSDFNNKNEADRFSNFDAMGNTGQFTYGGNSLRPGVKSYTYYFSKNSNDVTIVSPALNLTKGKKYRVTWKFDMGRYGHYYEEENHRFTITGGTTPTPNGMSDVIRDFRRFVSRFSSDTDLSISSYFESPVDGDYHVGMQLLSQNLTNEGWIYVTGFEIVESPDDDLAVQSFDPAKVISNNCRNDFEVEVYNNGDNTQNNYKVEVGVVGLDNTFHPFAETSDVPELASHAKATVKLSGIPAAYSGIQDLAARVILEGDGADGNNMSELTEVTVEKGDAFNVKSEDTVGESTTERTDVPAYFYSTFSGTQSIYQAKELGLEEDENLIRGLAWEYYSDTDCEPELTIWLGKTTRNAYSGKSPLKNQTQVFQGKVKFEESVKGEEKWMTIRFPESNFSIGPDDNLVVTVAAEESACNTTFPVKFTVYNEQTDWNKVTTDPRSIVYYGNSAFDFNDGNFTRTYLPVLHLALGDPTSGVDSVTGGEGFSLRYVNGEVLVSGVAGIEVYDLGGRRSASIDATGRSSVKLNLNRGVYILKAIAEDGSSKVVKIVK